jgi:cell division protein FtsN
MSIEKKQKRNILLMGLGIGTVVGVLLSLLVVWLVSESEPPFRDRGTHVTPITSETGKVETLPNKPGDKVGDVSDSKPRFDFYKILPNQGESASATPTTAQAGNTKPIAGVPIWLQAGAFQSPAEANNLKAKLALIGLDAGVQEVDLPGKGTVYRVRAGPFQNIEEMNQASKLLSQNGIQATQVKNR